MRLGVIVDGEAEYASFKDLLPKLAAESGNVFLSTLKADLQPHAPFGAMAKSCRSRVTQLEARRADLILILLDRETRPECPGDLARALQREVQTYASSDIEVVIKNRCFENWLLADLTALAAQPARFSISATVRGRVEPDTADNVDGNDIVKRVVLGSYEKVSDSCRIVKQLDVTRAGRNSRSFRRLLRVSGVALYSSQSRRPVAAPATLA
jgi:hypothetical protein